jgi:predicted murein hydrolase (TIGR00659 family)
MTLVWAQFTSSPVFALALTLGAYEIGRHLQEQFFSSPLINPVLIAIILVGCTITATGISYEQYFDSARLIHILLGPATVALAIPLYAHIEHIRRSALAIIVAVCVGAVTGAMSAIGLAWMFGAPDVIVKSLAAKSVTTPIAMGLSEQIGGLPDLTAVLVITTGIFGAIVAAPLLDLIRVECWRARGIATGVAAHGIGTAQILSVSELGGAFSGLGLGLCGLATAALVPVLNWLLWHH